MADSSHRVSFVSTFFYFIAFSAVLIAAIVSLDSLQPIKIYIENLIPSKFRSETTFGSEFFNGRLFTKSELAKYTGENGGPVYLAILGEVYDVTKGEKHYGVGGGYHFFAGKDGTRAFVSGDFTKDGLIEDTTGLTSQSILGLEDWVKFYKTDYRYVGRLIGLYYDEQGLATQALSQYKTEVGKALQVKQSDEDDNKRFPPCNFEYKQGSGRRIWCSKLSGGVKRDWVGVPRQYFRAGKSEPRCACVKDSGAPSGQPESKSGRSRGDLDNPSMKLDLRALAKDGYRFMMRREAVPPLRICVTLLDNVRDNVLKDRRVTIMDI